MKVVELVDTIACICGTQYSEFGKISDFSLRTKKIKFCGIVPSPLRFFLSLFPSDPADFARPDPAETATSRRPPTTTRPSP
ncbi:hypothetical protein RchiOBHm_Chr2g0145891 [Rosa chinensis]|uniref:Uncharacterized protein n=1 Tax=Rosa chinensis TaxID=74649 RepID=A0A2P6RYS0_ROSCH|nr:hypothetical protein RchiOBHm_Chr2g0145891 [Rosa chinensis]